MQFGGACRSITVITAQVTLVAWSAFHQLWQIYQLQPYLDRDSLATVIHTLVISWLGHYNVMYVGLPLKAVQKLQLAQNRTARLLTRTG